MLILNNYFGFTIFLFLLVERFCCQIYARYVFKQFNVYVFIRFFAAAYCSCLPQLYNLASGPVRKMKLPEYLNESPYSNAPADTNDVVLPLVISHNDSLAPVLKVNILLLDTLLYNSNECL